MPVAGEGGYCNHCASVCVHDNSRMRCWMSTMLWWAWSRGDPLEVMKFWCWSDFRCWFRIPFEKLALRDVAIYDNLRHFSHSDRPIFTKFGEMTETSNRTHLVHFGVISDLNESGYLHPFLSPGRNSGLLWYCIKDILESLAARGLCPSHGHSIASILRIVANSFPHL